MGSVELAAVSIGGAFAGLVLVYAAARLVATAWFKTQKEFEQENDEDGGL